LLIVYNIKKKNKKIKQLEEIKKRKEMEDKERELENDYADIREYSDMREGTDGVVDGEYPYANFYMDLNSRPVSENYEKIEEDYVEQKKYVTDINVKRTSVTYDDCEFPVMDKRVNNEIDKTSKDQLYANL